MLIDRWLPEFDVFERHETLVRAGPERAYAALRKVDLGRSPTVRLLFAIRGLPRMFGGARYTLEDFLRAGFLLLEEEPGVEIVLGAVGQFWRVRRPRPARVDRITCRSFDRPGFAKMAWNLQVEPRGGGRSSISTETRVRATDAAARRAFRRYWRLIGPFSEYVRGRTLELAKGEAETSD